MAQATCCESFVVKYEVKYETYDQCGENNVKMGFNRNIMGISWEYHGISYEMNILMSTAD